MLRARTRAQRGLVVAAFDRDATGERLWESMRGQRPDAPDITRATPPAGGKDWNDALRVERQTPQRDRTGQDRGH